MLIEDVDARRGGADDSEPIFDIWEVPPMGLSKLIERPNVLLDVHDVITLSDDEVAHLEQGGLIQRMIGTSGLMYERTLGTSDYHIRSALSELRNRQPRQLLTAGGPVWIDE